MQSLKNKVFQGLRSSERIFKLDMIYLARGGFWTTLSFVIGVLGSIATTIAFGNLLPRETFGIYSYLISLGSSLAFFTLSGVIPAITRSITRGVENMVPYALHMQLRYNLLAMATIGAVAGYYLYKENYLFGMSLLLLAITYPISEAFRIYKQILIGKKRFDLLTKVTGIITLLTVILTVSSLFLTKNVLIIIFIFAFTSLTSNIFAYKWATKDLDKSTPNENDVKELRRTAFHTTGAGLIGTIASYIDKIALFQVAGPIALAVYSFAIAGPERLKGLLKNWMSIVAPRLIENSISQIRHVFYKRLGLTIILGAFLSVLYILISPLLFKVLLPKYLDSVLYSQIYALSIIVVPASIYVGAIFSSQNMLKAVYAQSLGQHISRIILFIFLTWLWQIWGLIIASILSNVINILYSIIVWEIESRRLIKINKQNA